MKTRKREPRRARNSETNLRALRNSSAIVLVKFLITDTFVEFLGVSVICILLYSLFVTNEAFMSKRLNSTEFERLLTAMLSKLPGIHNLLRRHKD